mgnify:CR=1 FL=1
MKELWIVPFNFASVLGVDTGMFYKRRDYSTIVNGKKPYRGSRILR